MRFGDYYRHYLGLHQNKNCRRLHLLGMAAALTAFMGLLWTTDLWWACLAPLVVYPFAWTGHFLFEKNIPATWKNPLWAAGCELLMSWDILRGKIEF